MMIMMIVMMPQLMMMVTMMMMMMMMDKPLSLHFYEHNGGWVVESKLSWWLTSPRVGSEHGTSRLSCECTKKSDILTHYNHHGRCLLWWLWSSSQCEQDHLIGLAVVPRTSTKSQTPHIFTGTRKLVLITLLVSRYFIQLHFILDNLVYLIIRLWPHTVK